MEAIERVKAARAKGRPTGTDFIRKIFTDFIELHGDRRFGDDKAVVCGIARLIGHAGNRHRPGTGPGHHR